MYNNVVMLCLRRNCSVFFFQAEDGIRDLVRSRGLGDVYKRQIEDFNIDQSKKEIISRRLRKIKDNSIKNINPKVIATFRRNASTFIQYDLSNKNMTQEEKIEHVLRGFGTSVRVAHKFEGYSSNTYLLEPSAGVKLASIHSHKLDIANVLDVANVRVGKELSIYNGKSYLPVEFCKLRNTDLIFDKTQANGMKIPIGKDNFGNTVYIDLSLIHISEPTRPY